MASPEEMSTVRKLNFRLVAFLCLLHFFSWIDRANVGFAATRMNHDLKFSATVYGLGAGVFFIGYLVFGVPSNLMLARTGARRWLAAIMITWGIISVSFVLVQGQTSFYVLRFLLGMAEAGLVPGILYYVTFWFPPMHRAKLIARVHSASMFALITMGPVSGWLMTVTDGLAGVAGWRWLFLVEGFPSIIVGIITLFYLKDAPRDAAWLTPEEKTWLIGALEEGQRSAPPKEFHSVWEFVSDPRLCALAIIYFFWNLGGYGIMFWLPTILKSAGNLSMIQIGLLFSVPFMFAFLGLWIVPPHSDRTGERKYHMVICNLIAFACLGASALVASHVLALVLICIACVNIWGMQPIFWTLPQSYLGGVSGAAGIAFINSIGNLGGFAGPSVVGVIKDATGRFPPAVFGMALSFFICACLIGLLKVPRITGTAIPGSLDKSVQAAGK